MKLLVLAQTPPPVHGQSAMVRTLLDGLRGRPGLEVFHVNLPLSRDAADIGRLRVGKLWTLLRACARARRVAAAQAVDALYYVPAPGKRAAVIRDWIALRRCRRCAPRLVLHWHACGLAAWLEQSATPPERAVTRRALAGADLALVLAGALRGEAEPFAPQRIAVVPNGVADPCPDWAPRPRAAEPRAPWRILHLGLGCEAKGLFDAIEAVVAANRMVNAPEAQPAFVLTVAGDFADAATAAVFRSRAAAHRTVVRHAGFVDGPAKPALFAGSDCFLLPTRYPAEGQPLALLEALAHDLPVVATRWRAIPETVPEAGSRLVAPGDRAALARALVDVRAAPPAPGILRRHYLDHFTLAHHLDALAAALASVA